MYQYALSMNTIFINIKELHTYVYITYLLHLGVCKAQYFLDRIGNY